MNETESTTEDLMKRGSRSSENFIIYGTRDDLSERMYQRVLRDLAETLMEEGLDQDEAYIRAEEALNNSYTVLEVIL